MLRQAGWSSADALAALRAAAGQHLATILGGHTRTEAVAPLALEVAGLESPFRGHGYRLNLSWKPADLPPAAGLVKALGGIPRPRLGLNPAFCVILPLGHEMARRIEEP